jgi:hypothetical protein
VFRSLNEAAKQKEIPLDRIPHAVFAVHVIAALARRAGMIEIPYQTIAKLARDFEPLLYLLAHADCAMKWPPDTMLDLTPPDNKAFGAAYLKLARALLPSVQNGARVPLGDLVADACGPGDSLERILFLKFVARRLYGTLLRVDAEPSPQRAFRPRAAFQRFALARLNGATARLVAEQLARGQ